MGIAVYVVIIGKYMLNIIQKLSDILTSDETLPILRVIINICLFVLLSLLVPILVPVVIYVIIKEYILFGECLSWRSK